MQVIMMYVPHCWALVGHVILSSIGWRPALIQRVSRENSGQTELEERERVMQYNKAFFPEGGEDKENGFFLLTIL